MNIVSAVFLSSCFVLLGINRIINIKKETTALGEAVRFIDFVKNNIRYSSMNYENLVANGKKEGFKFIRFSNKIMLSDCVSEKYCREFSNFTEKIGRTDDLGQISLCEEYKERFSMFYKDSLSSQKGKMSVSSAVSVISVMAVMILL